MTAAESSAVTSKHSIATIVTAEDGVADGRPLQAALRLRLAPGWHTYWQNPGDAGVAPALTVTLPTGGKAGPIVWPTPQRVSEASLTTYAYTDDVILPFTVVSGPDTLTMHAHADWLACNDICVPEQADLDLVIPQGPSAASAQSNLIEAAVGHIPTQPPFDTTVEPDGTLILSGAGLPGQVRTADYIPLEDGLVEHAPPQTPSSGDGALRMHFPALAHTATGSVSSREGVLILTNEAGETSAYTIAPAAVAAQRARPDISGLLLLGLAGGFLLNFMPCVFPILAMKALALARLSGAERRQSKLQALLYGVGVITSFLALGLSLLLFREAGHGLGWGFQFQSPVFVTAVSWLLLAIGLNLSGVYSVGAGLMGLGGAMSQKGHYAGSFLTGVLAVVVASPCTAPFMGTALAGSLTLPAPVALSVFAALGVGLAAPYVAVAFIPHLSRLLPRPGRWMQSLQQLMAFPIYAAVVWLVWVVSQQTGPSGVLIAGIGGLLVALASWLLGGARHRSGWSLRATKLTAAIAAAAPIALLAIATPAPSAGSASVHEPFTTARLDELRHNGQPVFVNMTAAWCLSCLVNEQVALSTSAVRDAFAEGHVTYLKGDWTSQNPAISAYLHDLGQDGVPLYVMYLPGRPPLVLPQVLTQGTILAALGSARG